jgi:hypothetical protein
MTRAHLASFALIVVAALGSTGCGVRYRRVRYAYGCAASVPVYVARPAPVEVAPPPPPAPLPPPPAYSAAPKPIVVYANVPRTYVIVIPSTGGQPVVQAVPQIAPQAPAAPAPRPAPQPAPQDGWFEE